MPDGSVVALVSKQVTAYNAVNNSTVSRTSASKYGEFTELSWGGEDALSSCCRGSWTPGGREVGVESGRLAAGEESQAGEETPGSGQEL